MTGLFSPRRAATQKKLSMDLTASQVVLTRTSPPSSPRENNRNSYHISPLPSKSDRRRIISMSSSIPSPNSPRGLTFQESLSHFDEDGSSKE